MDNNDENKALSKNIDENMRNIKNLFNNCCDIAFREFAINDGKTKCFIVFFEGAVKIDSISDNILKPLMDTHIKSITGQYFNVNWIIEQVKLSTAPVSQVEEVNDLMEVADKLLNGYCVLFVDQNPKALSFDVVGWEERKTGKAEIEPVLRGSTESFVENININTSLLRKRIRTANLKLERMNIGRISKTSVIIAYIEGIAEDGVVEEIRKRLKKIDIDILIESGNLEHFLNDSPLSIFPLIEFTERPDSSALALSEGRVVIIIDGTPFVLIAPAVFAHFFVSAEDNYMLIYFSPFIIILRYIAYFLSLLAPSVYIAITTYHQEMIPYQLLTTLIASRAELPFPIFFEVLIMEITFELLREAGERLPRAIGSSLSIVGAIVIGQAAIQSGLVSPAVVVLITATATASFVNPKLNMSRSIRVLKYPFMIFGATMGIFGIVMAGLALIIFMVSLRSVGVPYMSAFAPSNPGDWKSLIFKFPLRYSQNRPIAIQNNNVKRANSDAKPKTPQSNE